LIVRNVKVKSKGKKAALTLLTNEIVEVEENWRDREITKKIYASHARIPISAFGDREFNRPSYLNKHCSGLWEVLLLKEDGYLYYLDGENSYNRYFPDIGFERKKKGITF